MYGIPQGEELVKGLAFVVSLFCCVCVFINSVKLCYLHHWKKKNGGFRMSIKRSAHWIADSAAIHLWMHYQKHIKFDFFINELKITIINQSWTKHEQIGNHWEDFAKKKIQHMPIVDMWITFNTMIKLKQLLTRPFRVQVTLTKNHFCFYWLLKFLLSRNSILDTNIKDQAQIENFHIIKERPYCSVLGLYIEIHKTFIQKVW